MSATAKQPVAARFIVRGQLEGEAEDGVIKGRRSSNGSEAPLRGADAIAASVLLVGLGFWFAAVVFPLLRNRRWEDFMAAQTEGTSILYQLIALAVGLSVLVLHAATRRVSPTPPGEGGRMAILASLSVLLIAQTVFSLDPLRSLQYVIITLACILLLPTVWSLPDVWLRRLAIVICIVLVAFMFACPFVFGPPRNRWFGGIQPNHYAEVCLCVGVWAFLLPTRLRILFLSLAIFGIIVVNSRGAMFQLVIFVTLWYAMQPRRLTGPSMALGIVGLLAVAMLVLIADPELPARAFDEFLQNKQGRSFEDLSGRTEYWSKGLAVFYEYIMTGVGFRISRTALIAGAHSGIIQFLMDLGLFGVVLLLLCIVASVRLLGASLALRREGRIREGEYAIWSGLVILVYLGRSMIEPSFVGFASAMALTFMIALGRPVISPRSRPLREPQRRNPSLAPPSWGRAAAGTTVLPA